MQVFRRTTLNSQNTLYTCEQLEAEFNKKHNKRIKYTRAPSESASRTDDVRHVIEQELSDKASETYSSKNSSNGPIEHEINLIMIKSGKEAGITTVSRFAEQVKRLTQKLRDLQDNLVEYLAKQTSVMGISNLIQECMNEFSVEYLSSSELMEYLIDDMGKLLYTLMIILEEFEKVALESNVTIYSAIKSKIEKVKNLFSTVKTRAVSDFLEQHEFAQKYSDELQDLLHQKELDQTKKKQELEAIDQKLEQFEQQKASEQSHFLESVNLNEKNTMEIESSTNVVFTEPNKELSKSLETNPSNCHQQKKTIKDAEELKNSRPELGTRCFSAPQTLEVINNIKEQKPLETLSPVPDQSIPRNLRAQSVPELSSEPVSNPNMRKVVVLQLVKYLQKKYDLNQDVAREKTIIIERKIRLSSPEMKEEYKTRYNLVVELMKLNLITLDELSHSEKTDWDFLQSKLDNVSRQKKKSNETDSTKNFSPKPNKETLGRKAKSTISDGKSTAGNEDF